MPPSPARPDPPLGEFALVARNPSNTGIDRQRLASMGLEVRRHGDEVWARFVGITAACSPHIAAELARQPLPASVQPLVSTRRRHTRWSWGRVTEVPA